jgi:hypothetical protein
VRSRSSSAARPTNALSCARRSAGDGGTAPAHRLGEVAGGVGRGGQLRERGAHPAGVLAARLVHPVLVEAGQQLARAQLDGLARATRVQQRDERAHVDPEAVAVERDRVARRDHAGRGDAECGAQLRQRDAQARARAPVEHVGPEAPGDLAARVPPRMQRQPREQQATAARARRGARDPVELEPEAADQADAQHRPSVIAAFALRERWPNARGGDWRA